MSEQIRELLLTLGIHSTYRGFHFLHYALLLCLQDEEYLFSISRKLYPAVADHFGTSRINVERCIRTAVYNCYYHGNSRFLFQIAGYELPAKPTNSEFLDLLYHYLISERSRT
nr:sporulation initiation factor Spo0A C-terminal domain-containing protein [Massilistercora timonensis]